MRDEMIRVVEDPNLRVESVTLERPCPECGDTLGERRTTPEGIELACATCGRVLSWRGSTRSEEHPKDLGHPERREQRASERDEEIAVLRRAGVSVAEIAERTGLSHSGVSFVSRQMGVSRERPGASRYSREDVLSALRAFYEENGRWPSWDEWRDRKPSGSVITRHFGRWSTALIAAGGHREDAIASPAYSDEELLDALIAYRQTVGSWPSASAWDALRSRPGRTTISERYGGWQRAIQAAQERYGGNRYTPPPSTRISAHAGDA